MTATRLWTPEEDRQMLAWHRSGVSQRDMAILLRSHHDGISRRLHYLLDAEEGRGEPNSPTTTAKNTLPAPAGPRSPGGRKCLRCGRIFHSAHAGNRLCYSCKQHGHSAHPFDPR
jgi:hypothetical protein